MFFELAGYEKAACPTPSPAKDDNVAKPYSKAFELYHKVRRRADNGRLREIIRNRYHKRH